MMKLIRALLLSMLMLPGISAAAISVSVGGNNAATGSSTTLVVSSVVEGAGERILHGCKWRHASATATVSDGTNTFNLVGSQATDGTDQMAWWESIGVSSGTRSITTTFSSASTYRYCASFRVTGSDASASQAVAMFLQSGNWTNATDNVSSVNMTPTAQPNAIVGMAATIYNARVLSAGTSFTSLGSFANWDAANGDTSLAEWRRTTSLSAAAATFTLAAADGGFAWGIVVGEDTGGGGGSTAVPVFMHHYSQQTVH